MEKGIIKMDASDTFITIMLILLLFNVYYTFSVTSAVWSLTIGAITGFMVLILATGIIVGITFFGTGLSNESIKILFGCGALLNVLFQITISGFPIGLGLATNVLSCFGGEFLGLGVIITSVLAILGFVSGLIVITGGG